MYDRNWINKYMNPKENLRSTKKKAEGHSPPWYMKEHKESKPFTFRRYDNHRICRRARASHMRL